MDDNKVNHHQAFFQVFKLAIFGAWQTEPFANGGRTSVGTCLPIVTILDRSIHHFQA